MPRPMARWFRWLCDIECGTLSGTRQFIAKLNNINSITVITTAVQTKREKTLTF